MKKIILITSYIEYEFDIKNSIEKDDFIICIDGGADIAMRQCIIPDLILGDMDSVSGDIPEGIPSKSSRLKKIIPILSWLCKDPSPWALRRSASEPWRPPSITP